MLQWELECGQGRLFQPSGSAVAFLRRLVLHNGEPRVQQSKNCHMRKRNMKTHVRKKAFYCIRSKRKSPSILPRMALTADAHAKAAIVAENTPKTMRHLRIC